MAGYTRQSSFSDGDTITAALFNNEYNQLVNAFNVSSGHTHDGSTTGDGGPISNLFSNALVFGTNAESDIAITFNAASNDGVLTWKEDEDYFEFSDDLLIATTEKIQFRDTAIYINSSTDGQLDLVADTEIQIAATTIDMNGAADISGNLAVGGNLTVTGNATISGNLTFGDAASDTVAFSADVASNLLPSADNTYDLGASGSEWKDLYVDGVAYLDGITLGDTAITATGAELNILDGVTATATELNLLDGVTSSTAELNILDGVTATAAEINALDGITSTVAELNILDGVTASATDINLIDGITNGTVIASKAIITDSNKDITGGRNITISGQLAAATLDISGDVDVDGTLEADAITVNGTTLAETISDTVGAMVTSNTETGITVTYEDSNNTLDFVIGTLNQDTTGNAATATALETARTIGGVSFDGSANINLPGVNTAGNQNTTGSAATLTTARTIGGVSFDGSANIDLPGVNTAGNQNTTGNAATATLATTTTVTDSTANTNFPVVFHDESNGLLDDTGALRYNPSTGELLVPKLTVAGTTTTADTVTMEASNAIIFEGATADSNETTLSIVDPTSDHTQYLINQGGYIPVLAAATTTQISATPAELNLLDGSAANTVVNSKAVVYGSSGELAGTLSTAAQTNITSVGTLSTLTVDDITINGSTISDAGDLDFDVGGDIILNADGGDIRFRDGSTEVGTIVMDDGSNTFILKAAQSDADIKFNGNDGGSGITALTLDMSDAGSAYFNNKVGIGTASPSSVLHLVGGSATIPTLSSSFPFTISNNGNSGMNIISSGTTNAGQINFGDEGDADAGSLRYDHNDNSMRFTTNASEAMRIDSSGNLLVGTTTSEGTATIEGDASASQFTALAVKQDSSGHDQTSSMTCDIDFYLWDNNTRISTPQARIGVTGDSTADQNNEAGGQLCFYTNIANNSSPSLTERMRITSAGNVGIGTSSPNFTLQLDSNRADATFDADDVSTWADFKIQADTASGNARGIYFDFDSDTGNDKGAGIVGISGDATGGVGSLGFITTTGNVSAERMRIDSSGMLGLGTTPPTDSHSTWSQFFIGQKGSVISERLGSGGLYGTYVTDNLYVDTDTGAFAYRVANEASAYLQEAATHRWYTVASGSAGAAATLSERMRIDSSGNLGLGTTSPEEALHVSGNMVLDRAAPRLFFQTGSSHYNWKVSTQDSVNKGFEISSGEVDADANSDTYTARLVIEGDTGHVGLGTSNPSSLLHCVASGADAKIEVETDGGSDAILELTAPAASGAQSKLMFSDDSASGVGSIIYAHNSGGTDYMTFATASTERMRIDSSGNVGIGTTSPSTPLHVNGTITFGDSHTIGDDSDDNLTIASSANENIIIDSSDDIILDAGGGDWKFKDDGTDIGLIANSSSDLIIQSMVSDKDMLFRGNDGGSTVVALTLDMSDAGKATFNSGATFGDYVIASDGTRTNYFGQDGNGGLIGMSTNHYLRFITNNTERMRIDSSGNLGIGTTSPAQALDVVGAIKMSDGILSSGQAGSSTVFNEDGTTADFRIESTGNANMFVIDGGLNTCTIGGDTSINRGNQTAGELLLGGTTDGGFVDFDGSVLQLNTQRDPNTGTFINTSKSNARIELIGNDADAHIKFRTTASNNTSATERMQINKDGDILFGVTSMSTTGAYFESSSNSRMVLSLGSSTTSSSVIAAYKNPNGTVGTVSTNGSATAYNTSSDARLKDVTGSARGLDVINNLNPVAYNWKADGKADEGLIAQEVLDVVPNAVSGSEEDMYQMDYSKLVVHLVAGMKEQQEQIEELKKNSHSPKGLKDMNGYSDLIDTIETLRAEIANLKGE